MKVICIDNKPDCPELVEGNIYNAEQSPVYDHSYKLAEIDRDPADNVLCHYRKLRFIPLSTIDETESETYKNLSHAFQFYRLPLRP